MMSCFLKKSRLSVLLFVAVCFSPCASFAPSPAGRRQCQLASTKTPEDLMAAVERLRAEVAADEAALLAERRQDAEDVHTSAGGDAATFVFDETPKIKQKAWTTALKLGHAQRDVLEDQVTALHQGVERAYMRASWSGFNSDGTVMVDVVGGSEASATWRIVTDSVLELQLSSKLEDGTKRRVTMRARALPLDVARALEKTMKDAQVAESKELVVLEAAREKYHNSDNGPLGKLMAYREVFDLAAGHEKAAALSKKLTAPVIKSGESLQLGDRGTWLVAKHGDFASEDGEGEFASWLIDPSFDPLKR